MPREVLDAAEIAHEHDDHGDAGDEQGEAGQADHRDVTVPTFGGWSEPAQCRRANRAVTLMVWGGIVPA